MNEKGIGNGNISKTVLHFSDGTLEVSDNVSKAENVITMSDNIETDWGPWTIQKSRAAGEKALKVCDYLGESLASFFGITTPKYQYEINEYYRILKEKEEQTEKDLEMGTWIENKTTEVVSEQVQSVRADSTVRY